MARVREVLNKKKRCSAWADSIFSNSDLSVLTAAALVHNTTDMAGNRCEFVKELRGDSRKDAIDIYDHIDLKELEEVSLACIGSWGFDKDADIKETAYREAEHTTNSCRERAEELYVLLSLYLTSPICVAYTVVVS